MYIVIFWFDEEYHVAKEADEQVIGTYAYCASFVEKAKKSSHVPYRILEIK